MSLRYSSAGGQLGHLSEVKSSTTAIGAALEVWLTFWVSPARAGKTIRADAASAQERKHPCPCPRFIWLLLCQSDRRSDLTATNCTGEFPEGFRVESPGPPT